MKNPPHVEGGHLPTEQVIHLSLHLGTKDTAYIKQSRILSPSVATTVHCRNHNASRGWENGISMLTNWLLAGQRLVRRCPEPVQGPCKHKDCAHSSLQGLA